jgi:hypothetical protein
MAIQFHTLHNLDRKTSCLCLTYMFRFVCLIFRSCASFSRTCILLFSLFHHHLPLIHFSFPSFRHISGFDVLTAVIMKSSTFQRNISLLSSGSKAELLDTCFMLISYFYYSSNLKLEAKCSSETSIDIQQTTHRYSQKMELL